MVLLFLTPTKYFVCTALCRHFAFECKRGAIATEFKNRQADKILTEFDLESLLLPIDHWLSKLREQPKEERVCNVSYTVRCHALCFFLSSFQTITLGLKLSVRYSIFHLILSWLSCSLFIPYVEGSLPPADNLELARKETGGRLGWLQCSCWGKDDQVKEFAKRALRVVRVSTANSVTLFIYLFIGWIRRIKSSYTTRAMPLFSVRSLSLVCNKDL